MMPWYGKRLAGRDGWRVETGFRTPSLRALCFAKVSAKLNFDLAGVAA
jgi:hypothetical protein